MAKIIVIIITPQPLITAKWASQVALVVKNPPTNAGHIRDPWAWLSFIELDKAVVLV